MAGPERRDGTTTPPGQFAVSTGAELERALAGRGSSLREVLATLRALSLGEVFVVGGFVRDLLAGRDSRDLDLAVSGDPRALAAALAAHLGGHAFALDPGRGIYRVSLASGGPLDSVDIAGLVGPIEADLARRDFTIDAMAFALLQGGRAGDLLDPFGGRADLAGRRLRLVSEGGLTDDPLRLLRGVRLAVEMELSLEPATEAAFRRHAPLLSRAARERQRDEVVRVLATPRAAEGVRLMDGIGLLRAVAPEVAAGRGVEQPGEHYYDVFEHSVETVAVLDGALSGGVRHADLADDLRRLLEPYDLDGYFSARVAGSERRVLTKLAGLYHDVAKPQTMARDAEGRIRFLGHAEAGAAIAARACRRLRFGAREGRFVARLVEEHLRPTQLSSAGPPSDRAIFRFFRDLGDAATACLVLSLADAAAAAGPRLTRRRWRGYVAYVAHILARHAEGPTAPVERHYVSGDTIMEALGIGPGPLVGRLLRAVDEAAGVGDVRSAEEALALAGELRARWRKETETSMAGMETG